MVRSLNPESDVFGPRRDSEEVLPPEYPYREAIGGLMYLTNCSRPDIALLQTYLQNFAKNPPKDIGLALSICYGIWLALLCTVCSIEGETMVVF